MACAKVALALLAIVSFVGCAVAPGPTYARQGYHSSGSDQLMRCTATGMTYEACCENHPVLCE